MTRYCWHASPVGRLLLAGDGETLECLGFGDAPRPACPAPGWREDRSAFAAARAQLDDYFAGARRAFDLPVRLSGTPFQQRVWETLRSIPYAATWSYAELARALDHERAVRAVGLANGRNPVAIVVPCHRVIGSDGSLTGFGGGLPAKRWLLDHERRVAGIARAAALFD